MTKKKEQAKWHIDQITKSQFFHQKLHEWGLLGIAHELEQIKGEKLKWNLSPLSISQNAWDKVIHQGIKPIRVFAHPVILIQNPKRVSYYRMLAMVSQKSMSRIGLSINNYEDSGNKLIAKVALSISRDLNKIVSTLVTMDKTVDSREFDIWRGMAAGSQAQGSWQNTKGNEAEILIKDLLRQRLKDKNLVSNITGKERKGKIILNDGREIILSSEPDIAIYKDKNLLTAVEIKGGIDPAGVLERFGATLKSLKRDKDSDTKTITILLMQGVSLTKAAKKEIEKNKSIINYFILIEKVLEDSQTRESFFGLLGI